MSSGYFDLGDGKLYYEVSEDEGQQQTLVLSHAAFLDGRMWDSQWDAFTQHYRVVRYDMMGFGRSEVATGQRSRRADLLRLLDHLQIERAHLLGCSMGGEIVIDLALEHPERVESIIVVNGVPNGFEMQGEPPPHFMEMIAASQAGDVDLTSELQLRIWFDGPYRTTDQVDAQAARQYASTMNRIFVVNGTFAVDMQPLNPLTPPAIERLNEIHIPVLIINGALDHAEVLRGAELMLAKIPQAQQVIIPNTAHVPNMEEAEIFNKSVLDFLEGV
ncbi:MAG: alpha/beta fold hydrolase [Caldilineaceae bacterium]